MHEVYRKLQLKLEKYESKEIMSTIQEKKKVRNGRAQKMQGAAHSGMITRDKYALRGSVEICNAYLEHSRKVESKYE